MVLMLKRHGSYADTPRLAISRGGISAPSSAVSRLALQKRYASQVWHTVKEQTSPVAGEELPDEPRKLPADAKFIEPQQGAQMRFAACTADIAVYGGKAGAGKSFGLLLESTRGINLKGYRGVVFRRECPHITRPGGLWDTSCELYPVLGARARTSHLDWHFPQGGRVQFAHMQLDQDRMAWQGSQIPFIGWDELTHFTEAQFWYLLSRNRSMCGMKPYVRATTNPDPDSWVRKLLDWWIGEDGIPIPERSGVIRWFVRDTSSGELVWADNKEELPQELGPKSFTFISAGRDDNPLLTQADPGYEANLSLLPLYERALLKDGNWNVRRDSGMRFKRKWFQIVDSLPGLTNVSRYWDRAATEPNDQNKDPDYTAGVKGGQGPGGLLYVTDVCEMRGTPAKVEQAIATCALGDKSDQGLCQLWLEQDPAQAGKVEVHHLGINLAKFAPRFCSPTGDRYVRSGPASSAAEIGRIKLLRGPWNERFLRQVDSFIDERFVKPPTGYHDDITTAFVGWYERMMLGDNAGPRIY